MELGKTGYYAGKLFIQNEKLTEIELHKPTNAELAKGAGHNQENTFLYDNRSGNVHFFPEDKKLADCWSKKITKKREEILNALKEKIKERNRNYKISRRGGTAKFANGTAYEEAQSIFKYIGIDSDNRKYDLIFCRFYKTEGNVNCILNGIQFESYDSKVLRSIDIYPVSEKDGEKTCLKDGVTNYYYNPYVKFDDKADDIADAFLEFLDFSDLT